MSITRATRAGYLALARRESASQRRDLAKVQSQAVTGLAVSRGSDDPVAITEAQRLSAVGADQDVWSANAASAGSVLSVADAALASVSDALVRAREIAVAMSSETVGADARAAAAIEVRGLAETLRSAANTQYGDRYVFAGTAWDTEPFAADGTYSGATDEPEARIGEDRWVRTGVNGADVFDGDADVFGAIDALATALEADDAAGVGLALDDIDGATSAISNARGDIGVETLGAEDAQAVADAMGAVYGERLSTLVEADPVETYTRLTALQSAYEATLQVVASASTKSLLDFL